jgi:hypothetical protein
MRKRPRFVVAFIPKTFSALCTLQNQAFIVAARVVRNDNDNDGDDDGRERPSSPFVVVVEKVFEDFFATKIIVVDFDDDDDVLEMAFPPEHHSHRTDARPPKGKRLRLRCCCG